MMFLMIMAYAILVTVADLSSAWLFSTNAEHWGIDAIRYTREGLMVVLALWGTRRAMETGTPFVLAALYLGVIAAYALIAPPSVDFMLVVGSAVKLSLPVVLLAAGYGSLDTPARLTSFAMLVAGLAVASTLFGMWDINNTEFWTETLEYGHFLNSVKGIVVGFDSYYVLPFNFFGFEAVRRAAGLVAAPLAQGSLVATGAMLGFAALQRRHFVPAGLILMVGIFGVWQSGTRGAMLFLLIALPIFLFLSGKGSRAIRNLALLLVLIFASYEVVRAIVSYSVNLEDGSTIGHLHALQENLAELDQVVLFGPGLGASGSLAADAGLELAGGGEGSIFSIAYQIGLPAALIFLLFYGVILYRILPLRRLNNAVGDLALAGCALGAGVTTSFISSDHIFSLSGMALFWIFLGGCLAQVRAAEGQVQATEGRTA